MHTRNNNKQGVIVGIDLSLTGTGVVVIDNKSKILYQALIKTKTTNSPTEETKRLKNIINQLPVQYLQNGITALVVIEGLAFMARNSTALVQLAGLSYLLRSMLIDLTVPFIIVAPTSLKKFTVGKGNAGKDEMMLAAYKRWGISLTNDNLADAYALARCGLALKGIDKNLIEPQKEVIKLLQTQLY